MHESDFQRIRAKVYSTTKNQQNNDKIINLLLGTNKNSSISITLMAKFVIGGLALDDKLILINII